MLDLYFWVALPFALGHSEDELSAEVAKEKKAIQALEEELMAAKEKMMTLLQSASATDVSSAEVSALVATCTTIMTTLEAHRQQLGTRALTVSLAALTKMTLNIEQASELHLGELRNCLKNCRAVSHRATLELRQCADEAEIARFEEIRTLADLLVASFQALLAKQLEEYRAKQATLTASLSMAHSNKRMCPTATELPLEAMKRLCVRLVR